MELITERAQLSDNIARLDAYLSGTGLDREFGLSLIQRGVCFVVTEIDSQPMFSPSRFIGYVANSRVTHEQNDEKDGRDTNPAIEALLGGPPGQSAALEAEYEAFCRRRGGKSKSTPYGNARKFWDTRPSSVSAT